MVDGFWTITAADPGAAVAGMVAVNCVTETAVVGIGVPLNKTSVPGPKFVPVIVMGWPAPTLAGVTAAIVGNGAEIAIENALDVPPPGAGFMTVMGSVPARCSNDDGISTDNDVPETYSVARDVLPAEAAEFPANPVPVKVTVAATVDIGI